MADHFCKHRGSYPALATVWIERLKVTSLVVYVPGFVVASFSPGIPALNGIVAAVADYVVADRLVDRRVPKFA